MKLPNIRIDEIVIIVTRENRYEPMKLTVDVIGCVHPGKYAVCTNHKPEIVSIISEINKTL